MNQPTAKIELLGLSMDELTTLVLSLGQPKYRAEQIAKMLARGMNIPDMKQLPALFREKLAESCVANGVSINKTFKDDNGGTEKYLYTLSDGNIIEGVRMRYKFGDTLCLSTQVGCRMGCVFCASTLSGLARNLTAGEMVGQIACQKDYLGEPSNEHEPNAQNPDVHNPDVHNIVLMGSGEPFDNYDETVKFLRLIREPKTFGISLRRVSLSTCGLTDKIIKFVDEDLPVTLCLSLHAPNDDIRRRIMPIAARHTIRDTLYALEKYFKRNGRRIIIEYALIDGVNDAKENAEQLASVLSGKFACHVNLIPLNPVPERSLKPSSGGDAQRFLDILTARNVSATIRRTLGGDIGGACGQLRRGVLTMQNAECRMQNVECRM